MSQSSTQDWVTQIGKWVVSSPQITLLSVFFVSTFSAIGLPFGWLSNALLALSVFEVGPMASSACMIAALLPSLVVGLAWGVSIWIMIGTVVTVLALVAVCTVLQQSNSWDMAIESLCLMGLLAVVGAYLVNPDIQRHWETLLTQMLRPMLMASDPQSIQSMVAVMAQFATGMRVVMGCLEVLLAVVLGFVWQSKIRKQSDNWLDALIEYRVGILFLGLALGVVVIQALGGSWAFDLSVVVMVPFVLSGVWIGHGQLRQAGFVTAWTSLYYAIIVVMIVMLPYVMIGFALLGLVAAGLRLKEIF